MPNFGHKLVFQPLDTNGDGTGEIQAIGDYSSAEEIFYIEPPAGDVYSIGRMIISLEDVGSIDSGKYGNGIALTNGITLRLSDSGGVINTFTFAPVLTNANWAVNCHDLTVHNFGSGNGLLTARWTFTASGEAIVLNSESGHKLEMVVNDDFSGLVAHCFIAQGHVMDELET